MKFGDWILSEGRRYSGNGLMLERGGDFWRGCWVVEIMIVGV